MIYKIKKLELKKCLSNLFDMNISDSQAKKITESILINKTPLYISDYITKEEEKAIFYILERLPWNDDLKRRTQQYGWKYPYKTKDKLEETTPIPDELEPLCKRLSESFNMEFDQLLVNEYEPGQGISAHVDHPKLFEEIVISISMGGSCMMVFENKEDGEKIDVFLEPRSMVALMDDFRYKWTHSIPARKSDKFGNKTIKREKRISLTFRKKK